MGRGADAAWFGRDDTGNGRSIPEVPTTHSRRLCDRDTPPSIRGPVPCTKSRSPSTAVAMTLPNIATTSPTEGHDIVIRRSEAAAQPDPGTTHHKCLISGDLRAEGNASCLFPCGDQGHPARLE